MCVSAACVGVVRCGDGVYIYRFALTLFAAVCAWGDRVFAVVATYRDEIIAETEYKGYVGESSFTTITSRVAFKCFKNMARLSYVKPIRCLSET